MTERTYVLFELTGIFGRHYTQSLKDGGSNPERVLRLFTDRVIEDLKKETNDAAQERLEPKDHKPEHQD